MMHEFGSLIAGRWVVGSDEAFVTCNPATPDVVVGRYTGAAASDIDSAVKAAAHAQQQWRKLPPTERAFIIGEFIVALESKTEELAYAITLEQGKPLHESRGEVAKACAESRFMLGEAARSHSAVMPSSRPGFSNSVIRRPRGVIAALTPWNFPIMTPMRKIAPALVFGNAVILKPSEFTPAAACIMAEASRGILPDGLLQLANGQALTGQALVAHAGVDGVAFTGSVPVGRKIYAAAAQNLTEVALELGGKNGAIIHDTDDMDLCLDQIVGAAFQCAGQRCTGISRVIVHQPLASQVCRGLVARVQSLKLGNGMEPGVTMGPMTNASQLSKVAGMVAAGVVEGATVLTGGQPASIPGLEGGYFYEPTILADVTATMSVAQQEIFGPVICVTTYESLDQALSILNDVEFGLTSSLFSNDFRVVQRFVCESDNGMLHLNHGTVPENHMPFGGIKNSGVGAYSVGPSAANFFTTEHAVYARAS